MKYVQDTKEKDIFSELFEDNPLGFLEKRTIDTEQARKKTKGLIKKCKTILSLLDKVEGGENG